MIRKLKTCITYFLMVSLVCACATTNHRVSVKDNLVYIKTNISVGQGFKVTRDEDCFILTPRHVVHKHNLVGNIEILTKHGSPVQAQVWDTKSDLSPIAILKEVRKKEIKSICGSENWPDLCDLQKLEDLDAKGYVTFRQERGGLEIIKVFVKEIEKPYLIVQSDKGEKNLAQGHSGTIVNINDRPYGILTHVRPGKGQGSVYPFYLITQKINRLELDTRECKKGQKKSWIKIFGSIALVAAAVLAGLSLGGGGGGGGDGGEVSVEAPLPEP